MAYYAAYGSSSDAEGYWLGTAAQAAIFLFLSAAPAAVGAAIEGSRLRSARAINETTVRSPLSVFFQQTWPSLLAGLGVQAFAIMLMMRGAAVPPGPPPFLLLTAYVAIIAFHTALGYFLGRVLPVAVSVPLALFLSYVWLGFSWSVGYFPLRYLAGLALVSCCRVDQSMPAAAPLAAIVFSLVAAIGLVVATLGRTQQNALSRWVTAGASLILIIGATSLGLNIARDLGPQPFEPRASADLHCRGESPQICLYPEQENDQTRELLTHAYRNVKATGIPLPPTIVASSRASTEQALNMAISTEQNPSMLIYSFSTSFLHPDLVGDCQNYEERLAIASVIADWFNQVSADGILDDDALNYGGFIDGIDGARALRQLDPQAQVEWITANRTAILDCSAPLRRIP